MSAQPTGLWKQIAASELEAVAVKLDSHEPFALPMVAAFAWSLAGILRCNGAPPQPLSVAAHSVLVGRVALELARVGGHGPEDCAAVWLRGLLHDVGEVVTSDVPAPVKAWARARGMPLDAIERLEAQTKRRLLRALVPPSMVATVRGVVLSIDAWGDWPIVEDADFAALCWELGEWSGVPGAGAVRSSSRQSQCPGTWYQCAPWFPGERTPRQIEALGALDSATVRTAWQDLREAMRNAPGEHGSRWPCEWMAPDRLHLAPPPRGGVAAVWLDEVDSALAMLGVNERNDLWRSLAEHAVPELRGPTALTWCEREIAVRVHGVSREEVRGWPA